MRSQIEQVALHRRALALGLVSSVAIHAGLFVGLRFGELDRDEGRRGRADRHIMRSTATMRAYDIVIIDAADRTNPDVSLPVIPAPGSTPAPSSDKAALPHDSMERPVPRSAVATSVRQRLFPRFSDSRLWTEAARSPERVAATLRRARARIEDEVDRYIDSIAVAEANEKRITDWTRVGAGGRRWGATPGRFYLGDLMIPYCGGDYDSWQCGVGVPLGRVEDYASRTRAFTEIREQRDRALLDEVLKQRIQAIRAGAAARRDSARPPSRIP